MQFVKWHEDRLNSGYVSPQAWQELHTTGYTRTDIFALLEKVDGTVQACSEAVCAAFDNEEISRYPDDVVFSQKCKDTKLKLDCAYISKFMLYVATDHYLAALEKAKMKLPA